MSSADRQDPGSSNLLRLGWRSGLVLGAVWVANDLIVKAAEPLMGQSR